MKTFFEPNGSNRPRWLQRSIARLQRAWNYLQRLVMVEHRQPAELVLIPIRSEQPESRRQSKRSTWRD
jgi:tRNA(Ser,Leu) C12 N-acetylase TAN1